MKQKQLLDLCQRVLLNSRRQLKSIGKKGLQEVHDEKVTDITTLADRMVSERIIQLLRKSKIPATLFDEERGQINLSKNPKYVIAFDDIDGTDNYKRARRSLPHCTLITIFDSTTPNFEDALIAGVIEHLSGDIWVGIRGEGCYYNGKKVKTSRKTKVDRKTLVSIDGYLGHEFIPRLHRVYSDAWVKSLGSAGFEFAGISSGAIDGFISPLQKAHELGAGYRLIKEAGGYICDLQGNPLDKMPYNFNEKYQIVAAATEELAHNLISKIKT